MLKLIKKYRFTINIEKKLKKECGETIVSV